jgi:inositol polyphosphate 5-phosphatase INPP5B/F
MVKYILTTFYGVSDLFLRQASSVSDTSTLASAAHSTKSLLPTSEVDRDPDMIVLGFQELDLSAEALLYSTGTMREDAWFMAVMAGLGEKGALYEKVITFFVPHSL